MTSVNSNTNTTLSLTTRRIQQHGQPLRRQHPSCPYLFLPALSSGLSSSSWPVSYLFAKSFHPTARIKRTFTWTQPKLPKSKETEENVVQSTTTTIQKPLSNAALFQYLDVRTFQKDTELCNLFDRIANHLPKAIKSQQKRRQQQSDIDNNDNNCITLEKMQVFLQQRLLELQQEKEGGQQQQRPATDLDDNNLKNDFVVQESQRIWDSFMVDYKKQHVPPKTATATAIITADKKNGGKMDHDENNHVFLTRSDFYKIILSKARAVDGRTWPITASMVLVGASVGVITPAMPFIAEQLALTTTEYGLIVSAFALAKMASNIPAAILIDRHGRKPYMVYSLAIIAVGVGGIGFAHSFLELYACRLLTGAGVGLLSGAATLMVTDLSTPLNRASTLAPIMSGFAVGSTLGPALGGILVDSLGLNATFYVVGLSYLGVAALNRIILSETQQSLQQPLQPPLHTTFSSSQQHNQQQQQQQQPSLFVAAQNAVGKWIPLLQRPQIQSIMAMNACYWFAIAGAQMTLLPLYLTDETLQFHLTATEIGRVYMGMSLVQIVGNPLFARMIDVTGSKVPAIVGGCTLIASSMAALPMCQVGGAAGDIDLTIQLTSVLTCWAMGASMLATAPVAYTTDHVSEGERAQAIALLRTCGDVGFLIGASAIGAFSDAAVVTGSDSTSGSLEQAMQVSSGLLFASTAWFAIRQWSFVSASTTTSKAIGDDANGGSIRK